MGFPYDGDGILLNDFSPLPQGNYEFVIKDVLEKVSKNGDPLVHVTLEVDDTSKYLGRKVWHNVTFISKERPGAKMAIHFLKSIDEPWEGKIEVNPNRWIGKRLSGYVIVELDSVGRERNSIKSIKKIDGNVAKDEEVPF